MFCFVFPKYLDRTLQKLHNESPKGEWGRINLFVAFILIFIEKHLSSQKWSFTCLLTLHYGLWNAVLSKSSLFESPFNTMFPIQSNYSIKLRSLPSSTRFYLSENIYYFCGSKNFQQIDEFFTSFALTSIVI